MSNKEPKSIDEILTHVFVLGMTAKSNEYEAYENMIRKDKKNFRVYIQPPILGVIKDEIQSITTLLEQREREAYKKAIDQLTKNWNNYIGDMPDKEREKLGYLELTGMLWGTAMITTEQLTKLALEGDK